MSQRFGKSRSVSVGRVLLHLLPAAILALLFVAVGVMHVTSRVLVVDAGYSLSRLESENRELMHQNDKLKLELATLKAPSRLEKLASEQLSMAPPSAAMVVNVGGGSARMARVAAVAGGKAVSRPGSNERPARPVAVVSAEADVGGEARQP